MIKVASIFARSGNMLKPWRDAGFTTVSFDIEPACHDGLHIQCDLRNLKPHSFDVVFCFPPCQHLAGSGALQEALELVEIAKDWCSLSRYWMIENPVGRLSTKWKKPDWYFHPHQFAGYLSNPQTDAYTKKTCIWSNVSKPAVQSVKPVQGSKTLSFSPTPDRPYLRSITPAVFHHLLPLVNNDASL